jgi:hypothetical protein
MIENSSFHEHAKGKEQPVGKFVVVNQERLSRPIILEPSSDIPPEDFLITISEMPHPVIISPKQAQASYKEYTMLFAGKDSDGRQQELVSHFVDDLAMLTPDGRVQYLEYGTVSDYGPYTRETAQRNLDRNLSFVSPAAREAGLVPECYVAENVPTQQRAGYFIHGIMRKPEPLWEIGQTQSVYKVEPINEMIARFNTETGLKDTVEGIARSIRTGVINEYSERVIEGFKDTFFFDDLPFDTLAREYDALLAHGSLDPKDRDRYLKHQQEIRSVVTDALEVFAPSLAEGITTAETVSEILDRTPDAIQTKMRDAQKTAQALNMLDAAVGIITSYAFLEQYTSVGSHSKESVQPFIDAKTVYYQQRGSLPDFHEEGEGRELMRRGLEAMSTGFQIEEYLTFREQAKQVGLSLLR